MMIKEFSKDIDIPDIVQIKAEDALSVIRQEGMNDMNREMNKNKPSISKLAVACITGVCVLGIGTSVYAYRNWNQMLTDKLQADSRVQEISNQNGTSDFPELSQTDAGVTVTADQTIVDQNFAYISFLVDGYTPEQGAQPAFQDVDITVDGQHYSTQAIFDDGMIVDEMGRSVHADGSPLRTDAEGNVIEQAQYVQKDGKLYYEIILYSDGNSGCFLDQEIRVYLRNLGVYGENEGIQVAKEGNWSFAWKLSGNSSSQVYRINQTLGDTGFVIKEIELSPISIRVASDVSGVSGMEQENAPRVYGVKLTDGTVHPFIVEGGWSRSDGGIYQSLESTNRIIVPDDIASVLFFKDQLDEREGEYGYGEENLYEISLH